MRRLLVMPGYRLRSCLPWLGGFLLIIALLLGGGWMLQRWLWAPKGTGTISVAPTASGRLGVQPTAAMAAVPVKPPLTAAKPPFVLDDPALEQTMLAAINTDRQANGLSPVEWDATAATAGALHAADMATYAYFSHWGRDGYGPEYRYPQVGGRDTAMENIYTIYSRFADGRPNLITDFTGVVRDAERSLMNSPGHRRNILMASHTHVGVGFAYNPQTGSFYLAQEFVDRYVAMAPLPLAATVGDTITIAGQLLPGATQPLINLAYEPFPSPMSVEELNQTGSYSSVAEIYAPINPQVNSDGTFSATTSLDNKGQAGVYSVRVWVAVQGTQVLASNWLLVVH